MAHSGDEPRDLFEVELGGQLSTGPLNRAHERYVLTRALHDEEPLVREHTAWSLTRLRSRGMA